MPNRDDCGQLLKFWGCRGCHTLNTPTDIACQHCAAPREAANSPRRVMLGIAAVAAVALFTVVGVKNWPAAQAAAKLAATTQTPTATPAASITPPTAAPITTPVVTTPAPPPPPPSGTMIAAMQTETQQTIVAAPPSAIAVSEVVRTSPPQTDVPPSTALVSVKWVNVRTAPMPGAAILGVIKPQTTVVVLASQDGWVRVKSDSLTGWVYGQGVAEARG
ncbi:MAG: SH3 domain-containing protein [Gemmatimonadetes bacterium]|nr:SH3 domain-containing protein [Gemmatimonadota bacterium]